MLSRHFLRSKVLQQVYACRIDPQVEGGAMQAFNYHIDRLNRLAIVQLALLPRLTDVAETVMDEGQKKFMPTDAERNPNRKLLANEFVRRLRDNFEFKKHMADWATCWDVDVNVDLIRESYFDLREQDFFRDYLADPAEGFEADRDYAIKIFRFLINRDALRDAIGERSLLWEDDFDQIAQYSYMHLKTLTADGFNEATPWPLMFDSRLEKDVEDMDFARELLRNTLAQRDEAEELIKKHLQGWEFERVALMDVILISMAIAELTGCPSIPEKVTIDEYIELSKEFSTDRSKLFLNGILDKILIELRSRGRINKSGRGLFDESLLDQ